MFGIPSGEDDVLYCSVSETGEAGCVGVRSHFQTEPGCRRHRFCSVNRAAEFLLGWNYDKVLTSPGLKQFFSRPWDESKMFSQKKIHPTPSNTNFAGTFFKSIVDNLVRIECKELKYFSLCTTHNGYQWYGEFRKMFLLLYCPIVERSEAAMDLTGDWASLLGTAVLKNNRPPLAQNPSVRPIGRRHQSPSRKKISPKYRGFYLNRNSDEYGCVVQNCFL